MMKAGSMDREDSSPDEGTPREPAQGAGHPHGYTLADAEMERLERKAASGDVLDPLALQDPAGAGAERVILRVGATVVTILVVAILLAQVACKNIRLATVADFSEAGVSVESVERALGNGILFGGEIVTFPSGSEVTSLSADASEIVVEVTDETSRSLDQLAATAQSRALALAMNAFEDDAVQRVTLSVLARASEETGAFTGDSGDPLQVVLTVTWTRDAADEQAFTCTLSGYDVHAQLTSEEEDLASAS